MDGAAPLIAECAPLGPVEDLAPTQGTGAALRAPVWMIQRLVASVPLSVAATCGRESPSR